MKKVHWIQFKTFEKFTWMYCYVKLIKQGLSQEYRAHSNMPAKQIQTTSSSSGVIKFAPDYKIYKYLYSEKSLCPVLEQI